MGREARIVEENKEAFSKSRKGIRHKFEFCLLGNRIRNVMKRIKDEGNQNIHIMKKMEKWELKLRKEKNTQGDAVHVERFGR